MSVQVLSDSSQSVVKEHPMFHTTSFPTSSSSPPPSSSSSRYAHSYSAPVLLYTQRSTTPDQQQQNDDTVSFERKLVTSDLPKIVTNFAKKPQDSEFPEIKPQYKRVSSDDDSLALATLPSPATSVHDFPAAHHVKHVPVRKTSSSSLNSDNKNYPHHISHSEDHSRSDRFKGNKGNHRDDGRPMLDHQTLKRRLSKFGLTNATELIGHYAILKTIGEGAFSKVKLAIDLISCKKVAIKMIATKGIQDSERLRASVSREVELLKYIDHPNIVGLLDTLETGTHLCLVLEYVPGGELFDYVNDHYEESTEEESKLIFLQLVNIMEYLHNNNIVHRDLKLENILIDSSNKSPNGPIVKLTDFGLAKFIDKSSPTITTRCGSEEYAAPELLISDEKPYDGRKTDLWSLGVVLYALLVGYLPFNVGVGQSRRQFYSKIIRADFKFPDKKNESSRKSMISAEAKDLVKKILQNNPQKRLVLSEIKNHPWLKDVHI